MHEVRHKVYHDVALKYHHDVTTHDRYHHGLRSLTSHLP
jgi:hypothetical protein